MSGWLSRWGPLAGGLSGLLLLVSFITGNSTPDDNATGPQVIAWYTAHQNHRKVADIVIVLAVFFLVAFAVTLPRHVRRGERWLANGALGGAVCAALGLACVAGFDLVLASDTKDLTSASAQTLNLLQDDFFLPVVLGFGLFGIIAGLAVVAGRILPAWMGWVLFAIGVVALVPPLSWFALLGTFLWVLVAGVWMAKQGPPAAERPPVAAAEQVRTLT